MEKEGRPWNFKTGQGVVKYDKFDARVAGSMAMPLNEMKPGRE